MAKHNKDCINGCKHYKTESVIVRKDLGWAITNEFQGYKHYCDKCNENYKVWEETIKTKHNFDGDMDCYEPTEDVKKLGEMISLAEEILQEIKK